MAPLIDLANLVEGAIGELDPAMTDGKPAIGVVENRYVLADCGLGRLARLQHEDHLVVLQCQRLRKTALFFPGKRVLQIVTGVQRSMQVLLRSPLSITSRARRDFLARGTAAL